MRFITYLMMVFLLTSTAQAQELFVFPAQGQSTEQQEQDEFQCHRFARDRTGFDPMQTQTATRDRPQTQGGAVEGALFGALLGTAVGAIAGNTGRGAAIGAASGGMIGGMSRADSRRQQDQWDREQAAIYQQNRNNFNRAFTACMEGRGYTVR